MAGVQQFTVRSGQPEAEVAFGDGGGTVRVTGGTVFYRDEPGVTASVNDGSIVDGGSATLFGTQFFSTAASRVDGQVRLSDLVGSSSRTIDGQQTALAANYTPATLTMALKGIQRVASAGGAPGPLPTGHAVTHEYVIDSVNGARYVLFGPNPPGAPAGGSFDDAHENGLRFVTTTAGWTQDFVLMGGPMPVPYVTMMMRVEALGAGDEVGIGWRKGAASYVAATYDGTTLKVNDSGTATNATFPPVAAPTGPFTLALIVTWPYLIGALIYDDGAVHQFGSRTMVTDLRDPAEAVQWQPYIRLIQGTNHTTQISVVRGGYTGVMGFRDPSLITYPDGTPFTKNGKYYFVFTNAAAGGGDYRGNFQCVGRIDPVTYRTELVSRIFYNLGASYRGALYGGHAIYDAVADRFLLTTNGFGMVSGGGTSAVYYGTTQQDITEPGVYYATVTALNLPLLAGRTGTYDNSLRFDSSAGLWKMVAVQDAGDGVAYSPALFTSPDLVTWTRVATDTTRTQTEGCRWARIGGQWWIVATQVSVGVHYYDANLAYQGVLTTNLLPSSLPSHYGSPPPHVCIVPVHDDTVTRYLLLSFDYSGSILDSSGAATRGSAMVLEATQQPAGHEFPVRRLLRAL